MKTASIVSVFAVLLVATSPSLALWMIAPLSRDEAKKMGMIVRSKAAGPDQVIVELEFKLDGQLKDCSGVELRTGKGKDPPPAMLPEDRSRKGRVVVTFTANRAHLDKLSLGVRVPDLDGGSIYELRIKDFVELKNDAP
jgi:hypothetical protein